MQELAAEPWRWVNLGLRMALPFRRFGYGACVGSNATIWSPEGQER